MTFRYTDAELFTTDEASLQMVYAPAATGPYAVLPTVVNPDDNTLSVVVDDLGFFFITEAQGEIDVLGNGNAITDGDNTPSTGDHTDFGDVAVGQSRTRTFTIRNEGMGTLTITDAITVVGAGFSVTQPSSDLLAPDAEVTFNVTFSAPNAGNFSGVVTIPNSDEDEDPFTFAVSARGVADSNLIFANGFE